MGEIPREEVRKELDRLATRGLSLLVEKGGRELFSSREGGLRPLLAAVERLGEAMAGARVIDKVVGGAAAKVLIYVGVAEVFAAVASRSAIRALRAAGIPLAALRVVERIRGRTGDPCPFEALADENPDPVAFFRALRHRLGGCGPGDAGSSP
ncbi:MAG: DUF1893 domain-containing protein [Caldiserica bacterium]|nr:DUF1893 domain-containing protein [Caldisericota bacterium]